MQPPHTNGLEGSPEIPLFSPNLGLNLPSELLPRFHRREGGGTWGPRARVAPPGVPGEGEGPSSGDRGKKKKSEIRRNFKVQEGNCAGEGLGTGIPKDGDSQQLPNLDKTFRWINPVKYLISISISEQPAALPSSELQAWSKKGF